MTELRNMQLKLLDMMKDLHKVFEENNISYYILGGTMLGAVRHKGFIPWDDDIDIGIPRSDYEKLLKLNKKILPKYLQMDNFSTDKNAHSIVSKIYNKETTLIEKQRPKNIKGIYIDVFPLDGCGNAKISAKIHYKTVRLLKFLVLINSPEIEMEKYKLVKFLLMPVSNQVLFKYYDFLLKSRKFDNNKINGNLVGAWGEREVMLKEILGLPKLYEFEDAYFYGPNNGEKYLENLYGNFMKLPPLENRISHHEFKYLNLSIPFNKYYNVE